MSEVEKLRDDLWVFTNRIKNLAKKLENLQKMFENVSERKARKIPLWDKVFMCLKPNK